MNTAKNQSSSKKNSAGNALTRSATFVVTASKIEESSNKYDRYNNNRKSYDKNALTTTNQQKNTDSRARYLGSPIRELEKNSGGTKSFVQAKITSPAKKWGVDDNSAQMTQTTEEDSEMHPAYSDMFPTLGESSTKRSQYRSPQPIKDTEMFSFIRDVLSPRKSGINNQENDGKAANTESKPGTNLCSINKFKELTQKEESNPQLRKNSEKEFDHRTQLYEVTENTNDESNVYIQEEETVKRSGKHKILSTGNKIHKDTSSESTGVVLDSSKQISDPISVSSDQNTKKEEENSKSEAPIQTDVIEPPNDLRQEQIEVIKGEHLSEKLIESQEVGRKELQLETSNIPLEKDNKPISEEKVQEKIEVHEIKNQSDIIEENKEIELPVENPEVEEKMNSEIQQDNNDLAIKNNIPENQQSGTPLEEPNQQEEPIQESNIEPEKKENDQNTVHASDLDDKKNDEIVTEIKPEEIERTLQVEPQEIERENNTIEIAFETQQTIEEPKKKSGRKKNVENTHKETTHDVSNENTNPIKNGTIQNINNENPNFEGTQETQQNANLQEKQDLHQAEQNNVQENKIENEASNFREVELIEKKETTQSKEHSINKDIDSFVNEKMKDKEAEKDDLKKRLKLENKPKQSSQQLENNQSSQKANETNSSDSHRRNNSSKDDNDGVGLILGSSLGGSVLGFTVAKFGLGLPKQQGLIAGLSIGVLMGSISWLFKKKSS